MFLEKTTIFFPSKNITTTPSNYNADYEDIFIPTKEGLKLHGWWIPAPNAEWVWIFFHGNGGNISGRVNILSKMYREGYSVLIIDYRGYGLSEGTPTEEGMYVDAAVFYEYFKKKLLAPGQKLAIFGRSLGGVAAVELAGNVKADALILDSTLASAADMAKDRYPFLPVTFLMTVKMNSVEKIKNVHLPVVIIHNPLDGVIPYSQGVKLFEAANEPKHFMTFPNAGHENSWTHQRYWDEIRKFLK